MLDHCLDAQLGAIADHQRHRIALRQPPGNFFDLTVE